MTQFLLFVRIVGDMRRGERGFRMSIDLFNEINNLITGIEQSDFITVEFIYDELVSILVQYEGEINIGKSGETK